VDPIQNENSVPGRLKFNNIINFKIFLKFSKIQYHFVKVYITEDRATDMVYVHSTLRLLENIQAVNYVETTVEWEQWAVADSDCERH